MSADLRFPELAEPRVQHTQAVVNLRGEPVVNGNWQQRWPFLVFRSSLPKGNGPYALDKRKRRDRYELPERFKIDNTAKSKHVPRGIRNNHGAGIKAKAPQECFISWFYRNRVVADHQQAFYERRSKSEVKPFVCQTYRPANFSPRLD